MAAGFGREFHCLAIAVALGALALHSPAAAEEPAAEGGAGEQSASVEESVDGAPRRGTPEAWWARLRRELFEGIELSAQQSREIDAAIEAQLEQRRRYAALVAELEAASRAGDADAARVLRAEVARQRRDLRPRHRIASLRTILNPEQQERFDTNRKAVRERARQQRADRAGGSPRVPDDSQPAE